VFRKGCETEQQRSTVHTMSLRHATYLISGLSLCKYIPTTMSYNSKPIVSSAEFPPKFLRGGGGGAHLNVHAVKC
jgi:hypothetical protein